MISLRLFGGISIERSDGPITGPARQRLRLALLALLALHRDAGLSRDKLLGYLWPDADAERGRHLLSNALYGLRQGLREDVFVTTGDTLRLRPDVIRVDVQEFLDALERDELARAVDLYAGPFLDGFFLSGAAEFENWVEAQREQLSFRNAAAREALAERHEAAREHQRAAEHWGRLAAWDPLNSRIAFRLMQSLARAGDPAGALRHARVHETLLREELGIEPNPEIISLVERLKVAGRSPSPANDRPAPVTAAGPGAPAASGEPPPVQDAAAAEGTEVQGGLASDAGDAAYDVIATAQSHDEPLPVTRAVPGAREQVNAAGSSAAGGWRGSRTAVLTAALVVGLLIATVALVDWRSGVAEAGVIRSLAVLPLENCTPDPLRPDRPDPEQEFFAAGLTDALILALARIGGLRVTSRTSVMRFKTQCGQRAERDVTLAGIARELDVDAVLEGMVIRSGDRLRINAQLIAVAADEHLWADAIDRDFRDVLALQDEVVGSIAAAIRLRAAAAHTPDQPGPQVNPVAYTHYLQGRYMWNEHQLASHREALEHFEQALAIDSSFAPAWSGVADIYVHLDEWGGRPERTANSRGMEAALRALELDEGLAEAHASLGHLLMHEERWPEAERAYRRAIELDSNNANARILYAFYLSAWERHEEALQNAVRALEVDPLAARTHDFTAYTLYFARRYDEAIVQWQRLIELYPDAAYAYLNVAMAHAYQGRVEDGLNWAKRGLAVADPQDWAAQVVYARFLALIGRREEAMEILRGALRDAPADWLDPLALAQAYAAAGNHDEAFRWLEAARVGNHGWLMFLRVDPGYDPLRTDARFPEWIRTMKLE